jgi:hypothetical protein
MKTKNNNRVLKGIYIHRGILFSVLIVGALLAFEIFNYSTTEYALRDLLGDLNFLGISWAVLLAIAFCAIDFAGIARLFTPEQGSDEPKEVWYLFGAWLLAATMNALLTWRAIDIAIVNHNPQGSTIFSQDQLLEVVPILVAALVWLVRVLIIGTFSVAGDRLFSETPEKIKYQPTLEPELDTSITAAERAARKRKTRGNNKGIFNSPLKNLSLALKSKINL